LIGHSLGGAAVLQAAARIPSAAAVITIAAPADPRHVTQALGDARDTIERRGEANVCLSGRTFKIKKQFLDDLASVPMQKTIRNLNRALLILHSPTDDTVSIENAADIFKAARHPKSFVSLDRADHLLMDPKDSLYAGTLIAAWALKYIENIQPVEIDATVEGSYPVIPSSRSEDLHRLHLAEEADLVLFMAGNQFMALAEIIAAFQSKYPSVKNIFYETLPPGLELKQIMAGGAIYNGELLDVYPDIYTSASAKSMQTLESANRIKENDYHLYLHNRLTLMVPPGNPAAIAEVSDLGRKTVRISQPDPANEDIALHIMDMYRQAGGEELVERIMEEKRAEGTTVLTVVHHRETPLRIAGGTVDVGPVWATEAGHAASQGLAHEVVEPGENLDRRDHINYYVCRLADAPHPKNAQKFLNFIRLPIAQNIYRKYGFVPYTER
jgi:ABC-type molybdate transport system substrate-binding protein/predicted alpha/beta hydrolase family esterase